MLAVTEVTQRRVDTNRSALVGRVLMVNAALIVAALAAFGLTRIFWAALLLFWLVSTLRSVRSPVLPLYALAIRRGERQLSPPSTAPG